MRGLQGCKPARLQPPPQLQQCLGISVVRWSRRVSPPHRMPTSPHSSNRRLHSTHIDSLGAVISGSLVILRSPGFEEWALVSRAQTSCDQLQCLQMPSRMLERRNNQKNQVHWLPIQASEVDADSCTGDGPQSRCDIKVPRVWNGDAASDSGGSQFFPPQQRSDDPFDFGSWNRLRPRKATDNLSDRVFLCRRLKVR